MWTLTEVVYTERVPATAFNYECYKHCGYYDATDPDAHYACLGCTKAHRVALYMSMRNPRESYWEEM